MQGSAGLHRIAGILVFVQDTTASLVQMTYAT